MEIIKKVLHTVHNVVERLINFVERQDVVPPEEDEK